MENDVQHLIDLLYDMIDNAKGVPLGNDKCIIERNPWIISTKSAPSCPRSWKRQKN